MIQGYSSNDSTSIGFIAKIYKLISVIDLCVGSRWTVDGEYSFADILSVRAGYKSLFLEDSEESFTLGAGFKQRLMGNMNIQFDYAYADFGRLGNTQKFSVGVKF